MESIRIGGGAGFSGDRIDPAVELAAKGDLQFLVFECLAERTIALAQGVKRNDGQAGYDPLLADRIRAVLPICVQKGIRIISNMGAANPIAAAREVRRLAEEMGLNQVKVAAVTGDNVLSLLKAEQKLLDYPGTLGSLPGVISANAYLGAEPIVGALAAGADVIIAGRVADPALFLAPMIHSFGWSAVDWDRLGQGTVIGHLLECAGQLTGGYFADPGFKDVPDLARLGFPLAEVSEDGSAILTKVAGTGGLLDVQSCTEQLLYELHDPTQYLTPDVVADFSGVSFKKVGEDRIAIFGGRGSARPETLKVVIGFLDGYVGEGQISYAGAGAVARGELALQVVKARLKHIGAQVTEVHFDLIGQDSVYRRSPDIRYRGVPLEVRARVAGRATSLRDAELIGSEVEALYTNGPAGGGGVSKSSREVVAVATTFIQREQVARKVGFEII